MSTNLTAPQVPTGRRTAATGGSSDQSSLYLSFETVYYSWLVECYVYLHGIPLGMSPGYYTGTDSYML
ncbi:MAG: hypothetical protein IKE03_06395 [Blautia sp.]|nr:hypothetical protein [Blautia sp.]